MEASANRIEPGRVIGEAFDTYGKYIGPLLGGAVILLGLGGLANGLLTATDSIILSLIGSIISLVATVLYTGYVVKLVQDVRDGRLDHSMGELFSAAAPFIVTLILNGILWGIAVFVGFLLLIVPGLILITIWAVVAPSIVVENRGAIEAFGRSRELVRGHGWSVFGAIVIAFLILVAVYRRRAIGRRRGRRRDGGDERGRERDRRSDHRAVSSILFFDLGRRRRDPPASEAATPAPPPAAPPPAA
jgi:hypothetical protein